MLSPVNKEESEEPTPFPSHFTPPRTRRHWQEAISAGEDREKPTCRPPLFIDLVYNQGRSRFIISLIFALLTSFLCFYVVTAVLFSFKSPSSSIVWLNSPPSTGIFGFKLTTFSAQVTDQDGVGLAGVEVNVRMYPNQVITRSAEGVTRDIDCVTYLVLPSASIFPESDQELCDPFTANVDFFLEGYTGVTDANGIVTFKNYRIKYGAPVSYSVVASHDFIQGDADADISARSVQSTVTMESPVLTLSAPESLHVPAVLDIGPTNAYLYFKTVLRVSNSTTGTSSTTNTESLDEFEADAQAVSANQSILLSLAADAIDDDSGVLTTAEILYSLSQLRGVITGDLSPSQSDNAAWYGNSFGMVEGVRFLERDGTLLYYEANLTFTNPIILAAKYSAQIPTVSLLGTSILIGAGSPVSSKDTIPGRLLDTIKIARDVGSITVAGTSLAELPSSVATNTTTTTAIISATYSLVEGSSFTFDLVMRDLVGEPLANATVFGELVAIDLQRSDGEQTAQVKKLSGGFSRERSGTDGSLSITGTTTISGLNGVYLLWFRSIDEGSSNPTGVILYISSSVSSSLFTCHYPVVENVTDVVTVGKNWSYTPTGRVLNSQISGISGKAAALVLDPNVIAPGSITLDFKSTLSDSTGFLGFEYVRVTSATADGNYTFKLQVDSQTYTVNRFTVQVNRLSNTTILTTAEEAATNALLVATCASIQLQGAGSRVRSGQYLSDVAAYPVNYKGDALPTATITMSLSGDFGDARLYKRDELVTASNDRTATDSEAVSLDTLLSTPASVVYSFNASQYAIVEMGSVGVVPLTFSCNNGASTVETSVTVFPRVSTVEEESVVSAAAASFSIRINGTGTQELGLTTGGGDALFTDSAPLVIRTTIQQMPTFVSDYVPKPHFATYTFITTDSVLRSASEVVTVSLTANSPFLSGSFVVSVSVDGFTDVSYETLSIDQVSDSKYSLSVVVPAPTEANVGSALSTQPSVKVVDHLGQPVAGAQVVAEIRCRESDATTNSYLRPLSDTADLSVGAIASLYISNLPVATTNANGTATFSGLGFSGVYSSGFFQLRYTLGVDVSGASVSVEEAHNTYVTKSSSITLSQLSTFSLYGIPGVPLEDNLLVLAQHGVLPYLGAFGRVSLNSSVVSSAITLQPNTLQESVYSTGVFNISNITLPHGTASGKYSVRLTLPGGDYFATTGITFTTAASSAEVLLAPLSNIIVGQPIPVQIKVRIADGKVLPNATIVATLTAGDGDCIFDGCGLLDPLTTRSTTDSNGIARFSLILRSGAAGSYSIKFNVIGSVSSLMERAGGLASSVIDFSTAGLANSQQALQLADTVSGGQVTASTQSSADYAAAYATNRVSSYAEGYGVYGAAGLATSSMFKLLASTSEVSYTTGTLTVTHSVGSLKVVQQPNLGFTSELEVNLIFGSVFATQPRIQVLDQAGQPYVNKDVTIRLNPATRIISVNTTNMITDLNGELLVSDLRMFDGEVGTFTLQFSVDGFIVDSDSFTILANVLTSSELVQILASLLIVLLLPVFFTTIPRNSPKWYPFSFFIVLTLAIAYSVTLADDSLVGGTSNVFIILQATESCILAWTIFVVQLVIAGVWYLGRENWNLRVFDGEARVLVIYRYTKWVLNVRRPLRSQEEWERMKQVDDDQKCFPTMKRQIQGTITKTAEFAEVDAETRKRWRLRQKTEEQHLTPDKVNLYNDQFQVPPIEVPSDLQRCVQYPTRFLVTFSVSIVCIICATLIFLWVLDLWVGNMVAIRAAIPQPPSLSSSDIKKFNFEIRSSLILMFNLLAEAVSDYSFVARFESLVNDVDFYVFWETAYIFMTDLIDNMEMNFAISVALASAACCVIWAFLFAAVIPLMWKIRRGELRSMRADVRLIDADRYMGMQVWHILVTFIVIFVLLFIIVVVTTSTLFHAFLANILTNLVLPTMSSAIVTSIIEILVVGQILSNGLVIKMVHPYFWWSAFAIILSLVNGFIRTVQRWIMLVMSFTLLFARLDLDLFPNVLLVLDSSYTSFYAMLFVDEEYNNPIFLTAVTSFTTDLLVQRQHEKNEPYVHMERLSDQLQLPLMRSLALIRFRDLTGNPLDLRQPYTASPYVSMNSHLMCARSKRRRRAFNRWRLAVLLTFNPSLRKMRKQYRQYLAKIQELEELDAQEEEVRQEERRRKQELREQEEAEARKKHAEEEVAYVLREAFAAKKAAAAAAAAEATEAESAKNERQTSMLEVHSVTASQDGGSSQLLHVPLGSSDPPPGNQAAAAVGDGDGRRTNDSFPTTDAAQHVYQPGEV